MQKTKGCIHNYIYPNHRTENHKTDGIWPGDLSVKRELSKIVVTRKILKTYPVLFEI